MYTTKEAGDKLGISEDHMRLLARKGLIKAQKIGRDWIILELDYQRKRSPKIRREK
jgi:excisionase family DNA binding protein